MCACLNASVLYFKLTFCNYGMLLFVLVLGGGGATGLQREERLLR